MRVQYDHLLNPGKREVLADLVIAAHGSSAPVWKLLMLGFLRKYAGYVLWRGTVREDLVRSSTRRCHRARYWFTALTLDKYYGM